MLKPKVRSLITAQLEGRLISTSSKTSPQVSVIIVNYNAGEWLSRTVQSLLDQTLADFECFIVDNGSTDASMAGLPKLDDRFEVILAGENLGFAAGNNLAAKKAAAPWIALLNPDAFARPDWLEKALAETKRSPDVTMVGSTQYLALETEKFDGLGDFYHMTGLAWRAGFGKPVTPVKTGEAFGPCGAGAFYHRETFLRLGGFDERFFCYHEDVDMAFRMRLAGGICVQSADAIIDHVSSGISGRASDFAVYHGTRNRIWTFFKNMPGPLLVLLTPLHIALHAAMLFWSCYRPGRFGPTWRGMRDGVMGLPDVAEDRAATQAERRISSRETLRALAVSPFKVVRRAVPNIQSRLFSDKPSS